MIESFIYDVFGDKIPAQRMQKCRILYHLARTCKTDGTLLDLGTWHGYTALSLAYGVAETPWPERSVSTVDAFTDRKGWANEPYGPKDLKIYERNAEIAEIRYAIVKPVLYREDAQTLAYHFLEPVALLHWDLGCDNRLENDVLAWLPHLAPGATIALHDTMTHRFHAMETLMALKAGGYLADVRTLPAGLHVAEKIA